jgi:hypothetical protein
MLSGACADVIERQGSARASGDLALFHVHGSFLRPFSPSAPLGPRLCELGA